MQHYPTVEVTPNMRKCVEILMEAVLALEDGPVKDRAEAALNYINLTFDGEPQPLGGDRCPPERLVVGGGG
jgi:hypothetical protein